MLSSCILCNAVYNGSPPSSLLRPLLHSQVMILETSTHPMLHLHSSSQFCKPHPLDLCSLNQLLYLLGRIRHPLVQIPWILSHWKCRFNRLHSPSRCALSDLFP